MTVVAGPWRVSAAHLRAVAIGVVGVTIAVLFRLPVLLVLAAPWAIVAVWSTATRPSGTATLSSSLRPETVREGDATTWTGTLSEAGAVDHLVAAMPDRAWLETRPRSGVVVAHADDAAAPATAQLAIRSTHWGRTRAGPIELVAVSPWGAFRSVALDAGQDLTTLPLPAVFDAAPSMHHADGLVGLTRSVHPGEGTEFAGIRPFRTGDRLRRINWRRSLRAGELHVTGTYADQDTHVALFVDALADFGMSEGIDGAASSLDTAVRAAGAIAEHFLQRGDRVSLMVLGGRRPASVAAGSGRSHLRRILAVLARVEPSVEQRAPVNRPPVLAGDALAIMLSPLVSPTALDRAIAIARHGLTVAVVDTLPDDVHVVDDRTTELAWRIRLLERRREIREVERAGVPVIAWRGAGSLDPFLREVARRSAAPRLARR